MLFFVSEEEIFIKRFSFSSTFRPESSRPVSWPAHPYWVLRKVLITQADLKIHFLVCRDQRLPVASLPSLREVLSKEREVQSLCGGPPQCKPVGH